MPPLHQTSTILYVCSLSPGGDTLLCLLAVHRVDSFLLQCHSSPPLFHFLFLSFSSPFWLTTRGTPVIHRGITVLSHTRHHQAKKSMLWCTVVLLPGYRLWGQKPGPASHAGAQAGHGKPVPAQLADRFRAQQQLLTLPSLWQRHF